VKRILKGFDGNTAVSAGYQERALKGAIFNEALSCWPAWVGEVYRSGAGAWMLRVPSKYPGARIKKRAAVRRLFRVLIR